LQAAFHTHLLEIVIVRENPNDFAQTITVYSYAEVKEQNQYHPRFPALGFGKGLISRRFF
jgi:hypothetical protein